MTGNWKQLFKHLNAILTPPTKYSVKLVKCFSSVWYVIPLLLLGAILVVLWPFWQFDDEKHQKNSVGMSNWWFLEPVLARWWHPVASSEALDPFHWAMRAVLYRCIAMAIETASKVGVLFDCCFVDSCPGGRWGDTERVGTLRSSPGHAALGNAVCIAPAHCRGYQNSWRTRCIRSSLSILSSTMTVAKDHVMVNIN